MTDRPREDNKQKSTVFVVSTSNSGVSSHSSTSGLPAGPSASEGNEHHVSPDDIRLSPKAGVRKETRKRKSKVCALLTDTPVKAQLASEVKAHRKSAKRSRLFSGSQEKSRKSKQLCRGVRRSEAYEEDDGSRCFCIDIQSAHKVDPVN